MKKDQWDKEFEDVFRMASDEMRVDNYILGKLLVEWLFLKKEELTKVRIKCSKGKILIERANNV